MGKHDDIEFLRFALGLTKEEFDKATEPLELFGLSVGNKLDAIATQSMANRLKIQLNKAGNVVGKMHFFILVVSVVGINLI